MKKLKEAWRNAKFAIILSFFGGAGVAYLVKEVNHKPQAGVVVVGDTILNTGGGVFTPDTVKLDTTKK